MVVVDDDMLPRAIGIEGVEMVSATALLQPRPSPEGFAPSEHDIAILLFTSGTTGEPKISVLRHANRPGCCHGSRFTQAMVVPTMLDHILG